MTPDDPAPLDLKTLVQNLNAKGNRIKAHRAALDALIDEDFADLDAVYKSLSA